MEKAANLINLSPWRFGGFTSVTVHAYQCLKEAGWKVKVFRLHLDKTEDRERKMLYGIPYRNLSVSNALARAQHTPTLVTGVARTKDLRNPHTIQLLIQAGARIAVHSHKEHSQFEHIPLLAWGGGVVIRRSLSGVYPGVVDYLPHPYYRTYNQYPPWSGRRRAGCIAMIVPHKNPEMLLLANRLLGKDEKIALLGADDRFYALYKLQKKYPEYVLNNGFSTNPAEKCAAYQIMVDLTVFDKGNGGTQYSFLETMDAGAVLVLHKNWLNDVGDMKQGYNCLTVATPKELAELVKKLPTRKAAQDLYPGYQKTLAAHGPAAFSQRFEELFA